jgi:hypothetical protein
MRAQLCLQLLDTTIQRTDFRVDLPLVHHEVLLPGLQLDLLGGIDKCRAQCSTSTETDQPQNGRCQGIRLPYHQPEKDVRAITTKNQTAICVRPRLSELPRLSFAWLFGK